MKSSSHSKFIFSAIVVLFFVLLSILFSFFLLINEIENFEENSKNDLNIFEKYSEDAWQLLVNSTREKRAVYRIKLPSRGLNHNGHVGPRYVTIPPVYPVPEVGGMSPPLECPPGPPGQPGHPGHSGEDGLNGRPGSPGGVGLSLSMHLPYNGCIQCPMGPIGEPGRPGPMGHSGDDGMMGMDGMPGARGPPGHPGMSGDNGMEGANGHDGAPGQPGRNGHRNGYHIPGAPGPAGRPGRMGLPGRNGENEMPGTPGAAGIPGKPGNPGRNGVDGHPGRPGGTGGPGADSGYCHCPGRGKTDDFANYKTPAQSTASSPQTISTDWRRKKKVHVSAT
uniref:Col_cuticle_N domain-containing protein n=1 Tax=Caenorhabditis japonica TaxID=281687 RepID=A0A8R1HM26_CAEJA